MHQSSVFLIFGTVIFPCFDFLDQNLFNVTLINFRIWISVETMCTILYILTFLQVAESKVMCMALCRCMWWHRKYPSVCLGKKHICASVYFEIITCILIYSLCLFKSFENIQYSLYFVDLFIGIRWGHLRYIY